MTSHQANKYLYSILRWYTGHTKEVSTSRRRTWLLWHQAVLPNVKNRRVTNLYFSSLVFFQYERELVQIRTCQQAKEQRVLRVWKLLEKVWDTQEERVICFIGAQGDSRKCGKVTYMSLSLTDKDSLQQLSAYPVHGGALACREQTWVDCPVPCTSGAGLRWPLWLWWCCWHGAASQLHWADKRMCVCLKYQPLLSCSRSSLSCWLPVLAVWPAAAASGGP